MAGQEPEAWIVWMWKVEPALARIAKRPGREQELLVSSRSIWRPSMGAPDAGGNVHCIQGDRKRADLKDCAKPTR